MLLNDKIKGIWHGGDYNPDQWLDYPEVLKKDIELMKKAGCNVMSIGIFSWSRLEPSEGVFDFGWLDKIIDSLYENGIYTVLATPSGGMPAWMAEKYPEVKRVNEDGIRSRYGNRHNNCHSSPIYREKVRIINSKLAERYCNHPAVVMWHISNEYNVGDCYCPLCCDNFRSWLKEKYKTIDELNKKWWNSFWSHNYSDFSQIEPPGPHGENMSTPLFLEWHRFKNDLLLSFLKNEIEAVRKYSKDIPVTTNFMRFWDIDYSKQADCLDAVSWDNYPQWHSQKDEAGVAVETAMFHSLFNSFKPDKPFMMMESSPSATNWQAVAKIRHPGVHALSSLQAVAHGSDTVQYFQWRKGRGQYEQFHGAVVGHDNSSDTRVFKEVALLGQELENLSEITGSVTLNEAAILFDYDNLWSLDIAKAYLNQKRYKGYLEVLQKNFGALWQLNIGCDFVFCNSDFSKYKVIIAPILFMLKSGLKEKIEQYVKNGGIFITTFCSGVTDEYTLAYFDDEYYPFKEVLGIKAEETDSLHDFQTNSVKMFGETYTSGRYCELSYLNGAQVIGEYTQDFYKGMPAVTVNNYGRGKAYYIATDFESDGYKKLYEEIIKPLITSNKAIASPENVSITYRYNGESEYIFILNFNREEKTVVLDFDYTILSGNFENGIIAGLSAVVLKKK